MFEEGTEGVKWELEIAYFVLGKEIFHALRLGFIYWKKNRKNWNRIKI